MYRSVSNPTPRRTGPLLLTIAASCLLLPQPANSESVLTDPTDSRLVQARRVDPPARDRDPDYGRYAPDHKPVLSQKTVSLAKEFRWVRGALSNPDTISFEGAKWIQLHFTASTSLGEGSSITITSVENGDSQTLDATTLEQWNRSSAVFRGDTLKILVRPDRGDRGLVVEVKEVTVNETPRPEGILPPAPPVISSGGMEFCRSDNRVAWNNPAVGRIRPHQCTGWIISNGAHLAAGHCHDDLMQRLEFEVPPSGPDGTEGPPAAINQYAIVRDSIVSDNSDPANEAGQDWAVFGVGRNTESLLSPAQKQQGFFRLREYSAPAEVALIGFGSDVVPPGTGTTSNYNGSSWTQQRVPNGQFVAEYIEGNSDVKLKYWAYSEGGASGGPIVDPGPSTPTAIGIHTNPCIAGVSNAGTGFRNESLRNAIQAFPGPGAVYVDKAHPDSMSGGGDGSIFRPYPEFVDALAAVPQGGILSIVTGEYVVPSATVIALPVTLSAPVGPVTLTAQ